MPDIDTQPESQAVEPTVHHRSAAKRRGMKPASMQLNITPMIDVIFQLLIYFIITASFTQDEGVLAAKMPPQDGSSQPDIPPQQLVVEIAPAGYSYRLTLEGDPVAVRNFSELRERLIGKQFDPERGRQGTYQPDDPVRIRPEGEVRWQHVVNAFNAAVAARYTDVGFAKPADTPAGP